MALKITIKDALVMYLSQLSSSDVDDHKHSTHLSIVEEGENSDTPSNNLLQSADQDHELSSVESSAENLAANTRANQQSLYSKTFSNHPNDNHENSNTNSRRPSVVLQEILSSRRPSAIMASLRRGSHSILSPFRSSKHDDPNDPAHSPEAVEYRRKNRRIGE